MNKNSGKTKNNKKTLGLALGSGGVKGLAHVGVIKCLIENKIPINYIAGSSIGAWVGAHYALFQNIELLEELTVERKKEKFIMLVEVGAKGGLVTGKKAQKLLKRWLENKKFKDTQIPFKAISTDLISGKEYIFNSGDLSFGVRASMAVPSMFTPVEFEDKLLVDGGTLNPVPDDVVKKMGADIVISVNLDNYGTKENFKNKKPNITQVTSRSFDLLRESLAQYSIQNSDIIINPQVGYLGFIGWKDYFKKGAGYDFVEAGFKATEPLIPKIKELLK